MKPKFRLLKFNWVGYQNDEIFYGHEIAGHFDVDRLKPSFDKYSIHTEYSAGKRQINSVHAQKYNEIAESYYSVYSNYDKTTVKVAKLWGNKYWAEQFAYFVLDLAKTAKYPPAFIEIHPPFSEYSTIDTFLSHYSIFSSIIHRQYPAVKILIENRTGTLLKDNNGEAKKFILSTCEQLQSLSDRIDKLNLDLRIALDIPQLQSAYNYPNKDIIKVLSPCKSFLHNVASVHLWGRKNNRAHNGNLDSYFNSLDKKQEFLFELADLFSDKITRLMVLEVLFCDPIGNTAQIINDLQTVVEFVK